MALERNAKTASSFRGAGDGQALLEVEGLVVEFPVDGNWVPIVNDVSFSVAEGETLGLVGESGSGKSMTATAIMGLLEHTSGRMRARSLRFADQDLTTLTRKEWNRVRGKQIGMVFQDPMSSLNPSYTVGEQIAEVVRRHLGMSRKAAWNRAIEMLDRVRIANSKSMANQYPHSFSGGMRQRVMIAMSLACEPRLLLADEPTTALDVTVQAGILDLLAELRRDMGLAMLFITHDLGVVAEVCDRVAVMYFGQLVEQASVYEVYDQPLHPFSEALMKAMPQVQDNRGAELEVIPGVAPSHSNVPTGCSFHERCAYAVPGVCDSNNVAISAIGRRQVRCARTAELELKGTR